MKYLASHPSAMEKLVAQPDFDIGKASSETGKTFSSRLSMISPLSPSDRKLSLQAIKVLIKHGVPLDSFKTKCLSNVGSDNGVLDELAHDLLIYALEINQIKPNEFTPAQTHLLWTQFTDEKLAELLVINSFDINAKNAEGKTPFETILEQITSQSCLQTPMKN